MEVLLITSEQKAACTNADFSVAADGTEAHTHTHTHTQSHTHTHTHTHSHTVTHTYTHSTWVQSPPANLPRTVADLSSPSDTALGMALPGPTSASVLPLLSDLVTNEMIPHERNNNMPLVNEMIPHERHTNSNMPLYNEMILHERNTNNSNMPLYNEMILHERNTNNSNN